MTLTLQDIDGRYRVTTVSDYQGPLQMQSDGETEFVNGETDRIDKKGCRWNTRLTVIGDDEVKFESTADPFDADPDYCLTTEGGQPTREAVTYAAVLKVSRKGDRIRLSGQITHGRTVTVITLTKI
jgi:hypothetical protein